MGVPARAATTTPDAPAPVELRGRIGVPGAVFALVGYIIGGSIFILPGELAGQIGPAVFVPYLVAASLALFVCFAAAQIGSAFPLSGGTYMAVSCVVSPFWGFVVVWMGVLIVFTFCTGVDVKFAETSVTVRVVLLPTSRTPKV